MITDQEKYLHLQLLVLYVEKVFVKVRKHLLAAVKTKSFFFLTSAEHVICVFRKGRKIRSPLCVIVIFYEDHIKAGDLEIPEYISLPDTVYGWEA